MKEIMHLIMSETSILAVFGSFIMYVIGILLQLVHRAFLSSLQHELTGLKGS
ncbi:hypothetical protein [Fredinandcohnia sp. 179-A 10B2 NHS]|uniref:hypothetical protein n=1 Tax=Fredinandcohnia sp. 179-A 10B2 NHS TaxID=3235176 RepID=UPI00399F1E57